MASANKRTLEQVNKELLQAKEDLANVKGTDTEVYARIVGYYRSVRNWNKGKRDEYNHRKQFVYGGNSSSEVVENAPLFQKETAEEAKTEKVECNAVPSDKKIVSYEIFTRKTCPNCPPVKEYMKNVDLAGTPIDVDTDEGIARASETGVFAAPTVIFYDEKGEEVTRAHSVAELSEIVPASVEA